MESDDWGEEVRGEHTVSHLMRLDGLYHWQMLHSDGRVYTNSDAYHPGGTPTREEALTDIQTCDLMAGMSQI